MDLLDLLLDLLQYCLVNMSGHESDLVQSEQALL